MPHTPPIRRDRLVTALGPNPIPNPNPKPKPIPIPNPNPNPTPTPTPNPDPDQVTALGSCFADEIRIWLRDRGFRVNDDFRSGTSYP